MTTGEVLALAENASPDGEHLGLDPRMLALRQSLRTDGFVSGSRLAEALGVSRTAVWKWLKHLKALGYAVESAPRKGYRLAFVPDVPYPWELALAYPPGAPAGVPVYYYPVVGSTNDVARALAEEAAPEGTLVVASEQRRGRGRRGREWISPAGGLYMSLVLRPVFLTPRSAPVLALMAALSVAEALDSLCGVSLQVKWPNDVVAGGRKLCGVLAELGADQEAVRHVVIGIGINVVPVHLPGARARPETGSESASSSPAPPISLAELGCLCRRADVAACVLRRLRSWYTWLRGSGEEGAQRITDAVIPRLLWHGEEVTVEQAGQLQTGRLQGLDPNGGLILRRPDGRPQRFYAGEISMRRAGAGVQAAVAEREPEKAGRPAQEGLPGGGGTRDARPKDA